MPAVVETKASRNTDAIMSSSSPPIRSSPFAVTLMQLAADYATACLEELAETRASSSTAPKAGQSKSSMPVVKQEYSLAAETSTVADEEGNALFAARARRARKLVDLIASMTAAPTKRETNTANGSGWTATGATCESSVAACPPNLGEGVFTCQERFGSTVAGVAVASLHDCFCSISGTVPRWRSGQRVEGVTVPSMPLSLSEASLLLYGANTRTVFRRRDPADVAKRPRVSSDPSAATATATPAETTPTDFFSELSESQRQQRFVIYSSRAALLPRVDVLESRLRALPGHVTETPPQHPSLGANAATRNGVSSRRNFFLSPAIRELAALNVAAERRMLGHMWMVRTKAALLTRLPGLYESAQTYAADLVTLLYGPDVNRSGEGRVGSRGLARRVSPYFIFTHYNKGVVRVLLQHGLSMDVTYNAVEKQWTLLSLQWNVWAPLLASVPDDAGAIFVATSECDPARMGSAYTDVPISEKESKVAKSEYAQRLREPEDASLPLRCLVPNHQDAMRRYIASRLAEGGLEDGCRAANQLLCTVVMDVIAAQARRLQRSVFGPPLPARAFTMDVRQGTHVSVMVGPPITQAGERSAAGTALDGGPTLMLKFRIAAGTVVVEKTWTGGGALARDLPTTERDGASVHATNVSVLERVLKPSGEAHYVGQDRETLSGSVVVIDLERMLWDNIL